ncbi:MAG: acetolactate synthase large subunit, partial [Granulosicoccus sp.]|nr:acetolactate synthase large subunit [Granulosicoccus sp.]
VSHWVRTVTDAPSLASDAADAVAAARQFPGQIATLILPANTAWDAATNTNSHLGTEKSSLQAAETAMPVPKSKVRDAAALLQNDSRAVLILGGNCVHSTALEFASRIAQKTGCDLLAETSNARFERGVGRVSVPSIPYPVDKALETLAPYTTLITVNAKAPVAFFAYPDKPSCLYRDDAEVFTLAGIQDDGEAALKELAAELGASDLLPDLQTLALPSMPDDGPLNPVSIADVIANLIPDNAIIVDEAITTGRNFQAATAGALRHDWLQICGGSIGDGFPLATGAAVACPDRKVIGLQADGSGMYTLQALWTQARENLDITTIVFANHTYEILKHELKNVNAKSGKIAQDMMELDRPHLDWVALATGMGVDAVKVETVGELIAAIETGLASRSPYLIEALL